MVSIIMGLLLLWVISCFSNEDPADLINKITDTERVFSLEDFTNSGFKKLKKYKIKALLYWAL